LLVGVNLYKRKNIKFFFELPETRLEKKLDEPTGSSELRDEKGDFIVVR